MNEIRLYGPIGGFFGYSAEEVMRQMPEDEKDVTIRIHSPGGLVGEGIAMYHALKSYKGSVTTVIDGDAHSIASIVFLAGDKRITHKASRMLIHDPWVGEVTGNSDDLRSVADRLDETGEAILDIYEDETGLNRGELSDLMDESRYMRGAEMTEKGFATEVANDEKAELAIAAMLRDADLVAIKAKESKMSTQKSRRDIQAELDEVIAKLDAERVDGQAIVDDAQAKLLEGQVEIDGLKAEVAASVEAVAAKDVELEAVKAEVLEITAKADEANAAIEAHAEIVAGYEAKLESPAYVDAAMTDASVETQGVIDAEADAAEVEAQAKVESDAPKNILEEYNAMEPGEARRKFYADNHRAIHKVVEGE